MPTVDAAAARKAALAERLSRPAQEEDLWPTVSRLRAFRGIERSRRSGCTSSSAEIGHELGLHVIELLSRQPAAVGLDPGRPLRPHSPVAQQHLRRSVAAALEIPARLLVRAKQLATGLHPRVWHPHRGQLTGDQKPRQQLSVLAVGLDPIPSSSRRLQRRHDIDPDPCRSSGTA
jgi:hypothetical protein